MCQRKLLLSSDVELDPGPSDMDTVLSAIHASENKVLNEIRSCCQILYLVYSACLIYYANFLKWKKNWGWTYPKQKLLCLEKDRCWLEINNGLLVVKDQKFLTVSYT